MIGVAIVQVELRESAADRAAAGSPLRAALERDAVFREAARFDRAGAAFRFAFAGRFGLRVFTPSRECRMIVFLRGLAAFLAGRLLLFFMKVPPGPS